MIYNENDDYMLSTYDNPYDPFEEFEDWFKFDAIMGYNTCGLLAVEAATSTVFSDEVNDVLTVEAMERIVNRDPMTYLMGQRKDYANRKAKLAVATS